MREVRVKNPSDVIQIVPEVLGNFKVKTADSRGDSVIKDVRQLYAKTENGIELIWDGTYTPPSSTQEPTEPPVTPCYSCPQGTTVFYPSITFLGGRWDYCKWSETGLLSYNSTTTHPDDYYEIFNQDPYGQTMTPPPPGYILAEYVTYEVHDHVRFFVKRTLIDKFGKTFYSPSVEGSNPVNLGDCFVECNQDCYGVPGPVSTCGPTPPSIDEIEGVHMLFNSDCTATLVNEQPGVVCESHCYGRPDEPHGYHCRSLQSMMYPIYVDGITDGFPNFSKIIPDAGVPPYPLVQDNFLTIKDFGLICKNDCLDSENNSAWSVKIFIPIYVSLPDYKNKHIKINIPVNEWDGTSPPRGDDVILNKVHEVLSGQIPVASFAHYTTRQNEDQNSYDDYWGLAGFPREGTHTHVVMIEITKTNPNQCGICFNVNNRTIPPNAIRFFPINNKTNTNSFAPNFKEYMTSNIVKISNTYGIPDSIQITEELAPDPLVSDNGYFYIDKYTRRGLEPTHPDGLTFINYYNNYYQSAISTQQTTDCTTLCVNLQD